MWVSPGNGLKLVWGHVGVWVSTGSGLKLVWGSCGEYGY